LFASTDIDIVNAVMSGVPKWGINKTQKWVCFLRTLGQRAHSLLWRVMTLRSDMREWGEIKVADLFGQPNWRIPKGNNDWGKGTTKGKWMWKRNICWCICFYIYIAHLKMKIQSLLTLMFQHLNSVIFSPLWNTKELFSIQWQFLVTTYGQ